MLTPGGDQLVQVPSGKDWASIAPWKVRLGVRGGVRGLDARCGNAKNEEDGPRMAVGNGSDFCLVDQPTPPNRTQYRALANIPSLLE